MLLVVMAAHAHWLLNVFERLESASVVQCVWVCLLGLGVPYCWCIAFGGTIGLLQTSVSG